LNLNGLYSARAKPYFHLHARPGDSCISTISVATLRQFQLKIEVVEVSTPEKIVECYNLCFPRHKMSCSLRQFAVSLINDISPFLRGALLRRMDLILQTRSPSAAPTTSLAAGYSAQCVLVAK
jgi:hypothetical protein